MKIIISITFAFLVAHSSAQNWSALAGVRPNHISGFYDDTTSGNLIAYGAFDSAGTIAAQGIAQWNGSSWNALGIPIIPGACSYTSVTRYNGDLFLGGYITGWNLSCPYVIDWNGSTMDSIGLIKDGSPKGMLSFQNDLIVYGDFDSIENVPVNFVARWNGTNWSDLGLGAFVFEVTKMIVYKGELYASGTAYSDNLVHVFKLVNNSWQVVGQSFSGCSGYILDLCIYNNELFVGGSFSHDCNSSDPGNAIAKLDTASGQWGNVGGGLASVSIAPFCEVYRMSTHSGKLYVMGWFDRAGGAYAPYVAKWDGNQWCGLNVGFSYTMFSITDWNDSLFIGSGPVFNNDTAFGFVEWIGGDYSDTCGVTGITSIPEIDYLITIYPNPASQFIYMKFRSPSPTDFLINVQNAIGQTILIRNAENVSGEFEERFDVSEWNDGLYLIQIESDDGSVTSRKIIIHH